jgi:hypothetical protein
MPAPLLFLLAYNNMPCCFLDAFNHHQLASLQILTFSMLLYAWRLVGLVQLAQAELPVTNRLGCVLICRRLLHGW